MKKKINKIQTAMHKSFTLVELLVAMAVFSMLLVLSMQLFSGMQKLWVRSEQKNETFAAARTAMEFVASRIQAMSYSSDMPMEIITSADSDGNSTIFFPTVMPMSRKKDNSDDMDKFGLRFLKFELNPADGTADADDAWEGHLQMKIYSDRAEDGGNLTSFKLNIPPYRRHMNYNRAVTNVRNAFSNTSLVRSYSTDPDKDIVTIIENVTSFKLTPRYANAGKTALETASGTLNMQPYVLDIEISMIDNKEHFDQWKEATASSNPSKEDIFQQYGHTFRRAVLLTDRKE